MTTRKLKFPPPRSEDTPDLTNLRHLTDEQKLRQVIEYLTLFKTGLRDHLASNRDQAFSLKSALTQIDVNEAAIIVNAAAIAVNAADIIINAADIIINAAAIAALDLGEDNTTSSVGGGASLVKAKVGVDLPFRSLVGGTSLTAVEGTDEVTLNLDSHNHAAADINSGTIATARLGSGTPDGTTFLRGDQTYAVPPDTGADNTGSNLGTGKNVFKAKVVDDLTFRSIVGGGGLTATENSLDVTLDVDPYTTADGQSAAADTGQGSGNQTADRVRFTTVTSGQAASLRPAIAGEEQWFLNDGANTLKVYSQSGETVDGGTDVTLAVATPTHYVAMADGDWRQF